MNRSVDKQTWNPVDTPVSQDLRLGVIGGLLAHSMWGVFPVYFKLVDVVTPLEVLAHRVIWAVPFGALIVVGYLIRKTVDESPVFKEMQLRKKESSAPLGQLFKHHKKPVTLAALIFAANNAAGYLVIAFFASYGSNVLGMPQERWGISVGPAPRLRAPRFDEAAFDMGASPLQLRIDLNP